MRPAAVALVVLLAGCSASHAPPPVPDAGVDARRPCDPWNPDHPTLCHWDFGGCELSIRGCPDGGER